MTPAVPRPRRPLPQGDPVRQWYENVLGWPTVPGDRPTAPDGTSALLVTGVRFDVLEMPSEAARGVLARPLRTGPVARHGGRTRFLVAVGGAEELPGLLDWLEWGALAGELGLTAIGAGGLIEAPWPPGRPVTGRWTPVERGGTGRCGPRGPEGPRPLPPVDGAWPDGPHWPDRPHEPDRPHGPHEPDWPHGPNGSDWPHGSDGSDGLDGPHGSDGLDGSDAADRLAGPGGLAGPGERVGRGEPGGPGGRVGPWGPGPVGPEDQAGAACWLRPPEPGSAVEPSLPAPRPLLARPARQGARGGGGGAPDLVRLVDAAATECLRVRLGRTRDQRCASSYA
ncbi:SCO3374 family protein [Streptomyces sp. JNUCC 64]